jgi:hypothetical protein
MDKTFLDFCHERKFYIRIGALQGLRSQVAKGLLLYLDCNKPRKSISPEQTVWQPMLENRLFKFLFGLDKPIFLHKKYYDKQVSLKIESDDYQANRRKYAIAMQQYRDKAPEYRRQINDALKMLLEQGLIDGYRRVSKIDKNGKKNLRRLWLIPRNNYNVKQHAADIIDSSQSDDIPL